ncbi:MAG TPA: hypothetical protein VGN13_06305 [Solirubrobacteraceae bacterium]|jgi:hypothetical protein
MRGARATGLFASLTASLLAAFLLAGPASAQPLADDGGASWRLEQPPPPPPPPGVQGSSTPVGLGRIGDIQFWSPNRGLLTTAGNGSTIPPGLWAYNGREWHELSTVCGASDGRIVWTGPDSFWTISDGRPGQASDAAGNPPPLIDNTLCHFENGRVVASYASLAFRVDSYQPMHAAGCLGPSDCWFAGDALPAPQSGSFHLHWNGSSLSAEPNTQNGYPVADLHSFAGQLFESVQLSGPLTSESSALRLINPEGIVPQFETPASLPFYGGEEFPTALEAFHLSDADGALWAAAGPVRETPSGSAPGQVTVARYDGQRWRQLLGAASEPSGAATFPEDTVTAVAGEPGGEAAWLALDTANDVLQPSPVATARVARITAAGTLSQEDNLQLPAGAETAPKGAAAKITCAAPHDCWLASTQGWLYHLSTGSEELPLDTDPAFAGLITERPADEGVPQVAPDTLPADNSGLLGEPPPTIGVLPENPKEQPPRVHVALLSHIHSRLVHGTTLELRFHLAVRARIRLLARRKQTLVASTPRRVLAGGNRRLLLKLDPRRWPTKLQLQTHALAPLPTVVAGEGSGGGSQTVSTRFAVLPRFAQELTAGQLP